jgi:GT2 family glycosyltransferase
MDGNMGRHVIPVAEYRQTLHELNQRYRQAWDRAERLQDELDSIQQSRAYRMLCWWRRFARWRQRQPSANPRSPFTMEFLDDYAMPPSGTVSIVIPFKNRLDLLRTCLHGLRRGSYPIREILLLDNGSTCPRMAAYLTRIEKLSGFRVYARPGAFNFAALGNFGAEQATGDFVLFLNNDVDPQTPAWLEHLVRLGSRADVGVTGATLLYPDGTMQHAGIFPFADGSWQHMHRGLAHDRLSDHAELAHARTVPAVTGACLLMRRELFHALAGFDERLPVTYNDVDLCCRVRARGLKVAISPQARLWHHESLSRGFTRDEPIIEQKNANVALTRF